MTVALLLLLLLLLLRVPEYLTGPIIWAEDGTVFLRQSGDWPANAAEPYSGQLWPVQRALGAVIAFVVPPAGWAMATYLVSCLTAAAALSVLGQQRAATVFGPLPWRFAAAAALALVVGVGEVHGNLANLHWWLGGSLLVVLALPAPRTPAGRTAELVWIGLLAFSGPLGLVALPMVVWRLFTDRSRFMMIRAVVVATGAAVALVARWLTTLSVGDATIRGEGPIADWLRIDATQGYAHLPTVIQVSALALGGVLVVFAIADWPGPAAAWLASGLVAAAAATDARQLPLGVESTDESIADFTRCLDSNGGTCALPIQPPGWTMRIPADT